MTNKELRERVYSEVREELLKMGLISNSLKGHTVAINKIVDVVIKYQQKAYDEEAKVRLSQTDLISHYRKPRKFY